MTNTLYLPELREMLAKRDAAAMREFCTALHPARTAEFMEGLTPSESWGVLRHTDGANRVSIFSYFDLETQVAAIETSDRAEVAELLEDLPNDECVDLLNEAAAETADALLPLLPTEDRRDIQRLRQYPEDTAGAVMTTEFARLSETMTAREALEAVGRQAEELETIYYLYVIDEEDRLQGVVSARQLVSAMGKPDVPMRDLVERDVISSFVEEDQEEVAKKVARFDLLAIPVVDHENHMLGIVTHDDVIDVLREEAVEDAHLRGAIHPLEQGYMETPLFLLTWKRGIWITIFLLAAGMTAFILQGNETLFNHEKLTWLVLFIPLVIASGGNIGNQSATLVITAMATGNIGHHQWRRVVKRELYMGLLLGSLVG